MCKSFYLPRIFNTIFYTIFAEQPDTTDKTILNDSIYALNHIFSYPLLSNSPCLVFIIRVLVLLITLLVLFTIFQHIRNMHIIKKNELELRTINNTISIGVIVLEWSPSKIRISYANDGIYKMVQYSKKEFDALNSNDALSLVHPDDVTILQELIELFKNSKDQLSIKIRLRRKDLIYLDVLVNGTFITGKNKTTQIYCAVIDISYQEKILRQYWQEQSRNRLFLENSHDMYFEIKLLTGEVYISPQIEKEFGRLMPGIYKNENFFDSWRIDSSDKDLFLQTAHNVTANKKRSEIKIKLLKNDGAPLWCLVLMHPIFGQEGLTQILGRIEDIDADEREKQAMLQKAQKDTLTGLYRKEPFIEIAQAYLNVPHAEKSALIFIDLDSFKMVNDMFGHLRGDKVLIEVSEKLQIIFSNYDIISRFGGDEFCILVKEIPLNTLKKKLEWTIEKLHSTYTDGEKTVTVSASIGIAYTSDCGTNILTLMQCADKALYQAKRKGKNTFAFFNNAH